MSPAFPTAAYLRRIGLSEQTGPPTLELLAELQLAHLVAVPFGGGAADRDAEEVTTPASSPAALWRALATAGHDGDEATARAALQHIDPSARELALGALDRMGALLHDTDPTVVEAAAWAAGERAEAGAPFVPRLVSLATSASDALVREACVAALGAIGDERGLPAVLAGCGDKPAVRRRAVLALAPFTGPEVEAALQAALADHDWQVRQAAEDIAPQFSEGPNPPG